MADILRVTGMDRHTLREWVIRLNEQGADGLINIPSHVPPKLNAMHAALAIHGVRWRACDLVVRLYAEFGLTATDRLEKLRPANRFEVRLLETLAAANR